jgi:glycosyltransferase involved in cell wall biosynthesis
VGLVVGIDASRNRSGGAVAHILGILGEEAPIAHGISQVHVWSYKRLLDALPDVPWLVKHNPPQLEKSLFHQILWQARSLPQEARRAGISILLNTDAGSMCPFRPAVTMSRDMLSYEKGEMKRFGISLARLRLILLKFIQSNSLKRAEAAIFLTRYAANIIQQDTGPLPALTVIPHGVSDRFKKVFTGRTGAWPAAGNGRIRCLYVSNASMYKHQWMVIRAVASLRRRGHDLELCLAGGGKGPALKLMREAIAAEDPAGTFVETREFVPHADVPDLLAKADLFVFASSCENMPNTLLEAMSAGLPIACSDRGPMPEVLRDGGVYFDPEDPGSIANAIEKILVDADLRSSIALKARKYSEEYSWERCAGETWKFLAECAASPKVKK